MFRYSKLKCKCSRLLTLCIQVFPGMHKLLYNIAFGQHRVAGCIHILQFVYKIHDMADSTTVFVLDNKCFHSSFYRRCWVPGNSNYPRLGLNQNCHCHNDKCFQYKDICLHREIQKSNHIQFLSRQQKSRRSTKQGQSSF